MIRIGGLGMIIGGLTAFPWFLAAGYFGLFLGFRDRVGKWERGALLTAMIYYVLVTLEILVYVPLRYTARGLVPPQWLDTAIWASTIVPFLGLAVFGRTVHREQLLERWSFLPLSAGVLWSLFILVVTPVNFFQWQNNSAVADFLGVFVPAYAHIGLIIIGILLIRNTGNPDEEDSIQGHPHDSG